ncbi:S8 family serine peptidase [Microbacterium sp. RG1]|uniref:S8 family serine peptidase n=1 Tax=Microbacterium sp. RG1 TaxID=2489212 RepID=UPI0010CA251C|nr:S8 family serine peptidase [Microbacterium sp. RG1]QCQ17794.1 peptidase S8 [Microbacterium sp. RG1]
MRSAHATSARPLGRVAAAVSAAALAGVLLGAVPVEAPAASAQSSQGCNAATRIGAAPPALSMLQSDLAWTITRGAGVTVAVVDSGVLAINPHLVDAFAGGVNLVGDGQVPDGSTDVYGHGTAIAGQIAARKLDASGVEGLAPEAKILSVRVFASDDKQTVEAGFGPQIGKLAAGIRWAADAGAQIINVSMSTTDDVPEVADAVAYATSRGSLVIGSSGNRNNVLSFVQSDADVPRYPANYPGVLGVSATDLQGVVTDDSIHGSHVAIAAPGQSIITTSQFGGDCVYADSAPATSYSAGYVSAAAALVAAAHPDETPAEWAYRLTATAVRSDPDTRDDRAGWGVVQPYDAIVMQPGPGLRGPASPFPGSESAAPEQLAADPVVVVHKPAPDEEAILFGTTAAVGALIAIGGAGALGVFVSRRRQASTAPQPVRHGGGLYRDDEPRD